MRSWFLLASLLLLPSVGFTGAKKSLFGPTIKTVVIDAGHGGKDPGCSGKTFKEKDIALAIALDLGRMITTEMKGIKVIYTRETDVFIPLDDRAKIANDNKADLFICIHCNAVASNKSTAFGTETYVMGMHVVDQNLEVAKRENDVVLLEDNYAAKYDGYDPNSPVGHILMSLFQDAHIKQSMDFAQRVENQFQTHAQRNSRGVHQAGFLVLRKTAMPSVLIETGYLTNSTEEKFLGTKEGQEKIARSIFNAFKEYCNSVPGRMVEPVPNPAPNVVYAEPEKAVNPSPAPEKKSKSGIRITYKSFEDKPVQEAGKGVYYSVQLASSLTPLDFNNETWAQVPQILTEKVKEYYVYLTGTHYSFTEAARALGYWQVRGFKDAYVVAYKDGKRINLEAAKKISEQ